MRNEKREERRVEKIIKKTLDIHHSFNYIITSAIRKILIRLNAIISRNVINGDLCMSHLPIKDDE
jgi:hypothetical protein